MKLIMNEEKLLLDILVKNTMPDSMSGGYLIRLLVLKYKNDFTEKRNLVEFISKTCKSLNIKYYVEYKYDLKIKKIVNDMWDKEIEIRKLESVPLYKSELDIIKSCKTEREKKILFVCYIIARLYNTEWVNLADKDLFEMANITITNNNRQIFLYNMINNGYLSQSNKNQNMALKVNNVSDKKEDIMMEVKSFDNLGNQLLALLKDNYKQCESCGKLIKIKSKTKPEKYCEKCAYSIKLEQVNECKKRKKEELE